MFDRRGTILKHVRSAIRPDRQRGVFRPTGSGLQLMCINFWKNPGIVSLFDHDGNLPEQQEPSIPAARCSGELRGDGQEFRPALGQRPRGG